MRYVITIVKIEEKEVPEEIYLPRDERTTAKTNIVNKMVKKEMTQQIYQQSVENIDLPKIVSVINQIETK